MTEKENLDALLIIFNNIFEDEIICSLSTATNIQDLPDFEPLISDKSHTIVGHFHYVIGYYHNITIKVNPLLTWDNGKLFNKYGKLVIDLNQEGLELNSID